MVSGDLSVTCVGVGQRKSSDFYSWKIYDIHKIFVPRDTIPMNYKHFYL